MTRITRPDCGITRNSTSTHTTHTKVFVISVIDPSLGGQCEWYRMTRMTAGLHDYYVQNYKDIHIMDKHYIIHINTRCTLHREAKVDCHESPTLRIQVYTSCLEILAVPIGLVLARNSFPSCINGVAKEVLPPRSRVGL